MVLFGYQLRAVLLRVALTWPALAVIYLGFDLGDQGRRLAATVGWRSVLAASLLHLPLVAVQVLPAALLVGAVLALCRLRQTGELEAMALAGGGPARQLWPLLAAGLLAAFGAVLLGELLSPPCERAADRLLPEGRVSPLTGEGPPSGWLRQGRWFLRLTPRPDGRTAVIGLEHDRAFRVSRQLVGVLDAAGRLEPGSIPDAPPPQLDGPGLAALALDRGSWDELRVRPEALGSAGLRRRVQRLRATGRARPAEELLLQARYAFPCLDLILALVAWTLALGARSRPLLLDLLEALLWLLGLFLVMAVGWLLCRAGWLSPPIGAWAPLGLGLLLAGLSAEWRLGRRLLRTRSAGKSR